MRVSVTHHLGDLERDLAEGPVTVASETPGIVHRNLVEGNRIAQGFAREKSGPHGKDYYKRLTAEMTGPDKGEYGPEGIPKTNFVGAGWRHGVNTDLPRSADLIGPKLDADARDLLDKVFWPGGEK